MLENGQTHMSYRNQSTELQVNQLTGFYMRATQALNGLKKNIKILQEFSKAMIECIACLMYLVPS